MLPVIDVRNLVKEFPLRGTDLVIHAVTDVNIKINKGETLGLVGESGSGKTTTGRCVLRLVEPTSGEIYFKGEEICKLNTKDFRSKRPHLQMIFQEPYESLNPRMTARSIIMEPLKLWYKKDEVDYKKRVEELAGLVKMDPSRLDLYPHQLSGGEQQRVSIARSIGTSPDFLVLDEPTSLLDPLAQAEIMELLNQLQTELGFAYLFISHDLVAVRSVCDRVAIMYLSRIIEEGSVEEIFNAPFHPYSKALLSSVLYPDPKEKRTIFRLKGEIPSPIDLPKGCYFYSRCPDRMEKCATEYPPRTELENGHCVCCWKVCKNNKEEKQEILEVAEEK